MAETAPCPKCAGTQVRRASSWPRHILRVVIGSNKRYCPDCGEKWHIARDFFGASEGPSAQTQVILLASLTAILVIAVVNFFQDTSFDMKQLVRSYYEEKYGESSKEHLKEDWGWLYSTRSAAHSDYYGR